MKLSKLNPKKINFNDVDKNYSGQDILMKLGELYQFESGIFGYGNIWTKMERIVENIIIDELDKADCIQAEFPKLQPRKIWEQSGRSACSMTHLIKHKIEAHHYIGFAG